MSDLFGAPAPDPREHICRKCGSSRASCQQNGVWYCVEHAPADFWPGKREKGDQGG